MSKYRGFTLIESLIALVVVTAFLLLPCLSLQGWHEKVEEELFFKRFERLLTATQQAAITQNNPTKVTEHREKREWRFQTANKATNTLSEIQILVVPDSIILGTSLAQKGIVFKSGTGNNSDIQKIRFELANPPQVIIYQFQLGSGKYVKKIF